MTLDNATNKYPESCMMSTPTDNAVLTPEDIQESWALFNSCNNKHDWKDEPETSVFYRRCANCGGAEGIRFPEGVIHAGR